MEDYTLNPKYYSKAFPAVHTKDTAWAEIDIMNDERNRVIHQMEMIYEEFIEAVEVHSAKFYNSVLSRHFKTNPLKEDNNSFPSLNNTLVRLFDNIPFAVRKHIDKTDFWAHKRSSVVEDPLPFENYLQFELPPVCIDKAVREVLGYIAPPLIKNKIISLAQNKDWILECRGNYIIPSEEYNWSREMTVLFLSYEESYKQLKVIDSKIESLKRFISAA